MFAGRFSLQAAETVCGWDSLNVLDALDVLVASSLVARADDSFRLLQTIREFALEQLAGTTDENLVRERHAEWCTDIVEAAQSQLWGPRAIESRKRLASEEDNARAALAWAVASTRAGLGMRLAVALRSFWVTRGQFGEGRNWLHKLLALPQQPQTSLRSTALCVAGALAIWQDDRGEAGALLEEALATARQWGDMAAVADALGERELLATRAREDGAALAYAEEALALRRHLGEPAAIADALSTF